MISKSTTEIDVIGTIEEMAEIIVVTEETIGEAIGMRIPILISTMMTRSS